MPHIFLQNPQASERYNAFTTHDFCRHPGYHLAARLHRDDADAITDHRTKYDSEDRREPWCRTQKSPALGRGLWGRKGGGFPWLRFACSPSMNRYEMDDDLVALSPVTGKPRSGRGTANRSIRSSAGEFVSASETRTRMILGVLSNFYGDVRHNGNRRYAQ